MDLLAFAVTISFRVSELSMGRERVALNTRDSLRPQGPASCPAAQRVGPGGAGTAIHERCGLPEEDQPDQGNQDHGTQANVHRLPPFSVLAFGPAEFCCWNRLSGRCTVLTTGCTVLTTESTMTKKVSSAQNCSHWLLRADCGEARCSARKRGFTLRRSWPRRAGRQSPEERTVV
jgi:hypothetical protein